MLFGSLQAVIANCHKAKDTPAYDAYSFHPYLKRPARVPTADELKAIFGGGNVERGSNTRRQGRD